MQSVAKDTMLISKVFWLLFVDELTSHMSRVADGDDNWFWRCYFKMNFIHTQIWYLSTEIHRLSTPLLYLKFPIGL